MHKFYSEDRRDWADTEELEVGERLRSIAGWLTVKSLVKQPGVHRVYNMTVAGEHVYHVSSLGLLSHNVKACKTNNPHLKGKTPLAGTRGTGVARAAKAEVDLVRRTGRGTVNRTKEEIDSLNVKDDYLVMWLVPISIILSSTRNGQVIRGTSNLFVVNREIYASMVVTFKHQQQAH
jgi:hypothetical protein